MSTSNPFESLINNNICSEEEQSETSISIEQIFNITFNKNYSRSTSVVYLEELATNFSKTYIDLETLDQALFERLMLEVGPENILPINSKKIEENTNENRVLIYLYNCYIKLQNYVSKDFYKNVEELVMRNILTSLKQPELFDGQNLADQLHGILKFMDGFNIMFFKVIANYCKLDDDRNDDSFLFQELLKKIHLTDLSTATIISIPLHTSEFLKLFSSNEIFGLELINFNKLTNPNQGISYMGTLFGTLFALSILPKFNYDKFKFYDNPTVQVNSQYENMLWSATARLNESMYETFLNLLKLNQKIKNLLLNWISDCLTTNSDRGKLANTTQESIEMNMSSFIHVSDGFMINFGTMLLHLSSPFTDLKSNKILKVDPTYCAVENDDRETKNVHMKDMFKQTCLIAHNSENSKRPTAKNYNFITECFYMTHRCLDLGFRISANRLFQYNQNLANLQILEREASTSTSEISETLKTELQIAMQKYFSFRGTLLEPTFLSLMVKFHSATSLWLCQVAMHQNTDDCETCDTFAPISMASIEFPLSKNVPNTLKCVPEFIIENIINFVVFLRRFTPNTLEEYGYDFLSPIFTLIMIFMGSPERLLNPHLRGKLAECLEAMLPKPNKTELAQHRAGLIKTLNEYERKRLFTEHPHRDQLVRSLLHVFISIEMTGQSVQIEEKLNYRRPMYVIMAYVWTLEEYKQCFRILAEEAHHNMEATDPPLFLRFVNLLLNDAVFVLDEALSNIAQLKSLQLVRDSDRWNSLSAAEREQNAREISQIGRLVRFDNIIGRETISTIRLLAEDLVTSSIFTHSTIVDRVAAMLNYVLLYLVGPESKNFKIKDMKEYEFDPANNVLIICHIYVALKRSDAFCLAISQDGRSYKHQLFRLAEEVLIKIGGSSLISELRSLAEKVEELASQKQTDDEILAEAPEEFLDPIMSTFMIDPVILPSSRQTIDRTTIARHLLSDQTDPFNRVPLHMDQVIPNVELAEKIRLWIEEKKKPKIEK